MKKIFLLFLSSFLLTNVYAQCDDFKKPLFPQNSYVTCAISLIIEGENPNETGTWKWEVISPIQTNRNIILDVNNPKTEIRSLSTNGIDITTIKVKATIENAECIISDTLVIKQLGVLPSLEVFHQGKNVTNTIISNTAETCVGSNFTLAVAGPDANHTIEWTLSSGLSSGVVYNSKLTSLEIYGKEVGTYVFVGHLSKSLSNSCNLVQSVTVEIQDVPSAPSSKILPVTRICEGESVTFTATPIPNATSYSWSNDFGLSNSSNDLTSVYPFPVEGIGKINVTGQNICGVSSESESFEVEVVAPAQIIHIASDLGELCTGDAINIPNLSNTIVKSYSGVNNDIPNIYKWFIDGNEITEENHIIINNETIIIEGENEYCTADKGFLASSMTQYQVISLSLIDENEEVINNNSEKIVCLNKDTVFLEDNTAYQEKSDYVWKLNDSLLSEVTSKLSLKELFTSTTDEENIITVYKNVTGCHFPIGPLVIKVLVDDNCITNTITPEENDQLSIYPNPFSSSITLTNIPTGVGKIEVIDVLGNVVEGVENPASSIELGKELSTGTYFVHLYSTDGVQVEKVMKVN